MAKRSYILTKTAESDFREARNWSLKRWGKENTVRYFQDLHESAEAIAKNHFSLSESSQLTNSENLLVWPVREHYLVYLPYKDEKIIIVSLIRQVRDVPEILSRNRFLIERELKKIR